MTVQRVKYVIEDSDEPAACPMNPLPVPKINLKAHHVTLVMLMFWSGTSRPKTRQQQKTDFLISCWY